MRHTREPESYMGNLRRPQIVLSFLALCFDGAYLICATWFVLYCVFCEFVWIARFLRLLVLLLLIS